MRVKLADLTLDQIRVATGGGVTSVRVNDVVLAPEAAALLNALTASVAFSPTGPAFDLAVSV